MNQKITVISFDHWDYDQHIVTTLLKKGVIANHVKIGKFKHKNLFERISNTLAKIFLNKNPKLKKRQDFIINSLQKLGLQDQILVINPELIDKNYHYEIKKYTKKYIAYLYDSVARCNIEHLLENIFDKIYSFDKNDIQKYSFSETTNYNYIDSEQYKFKKENKYDVLFVGSIDNRLEVVQKLKSTFNKLNLNFKLLIIGKKATWIKVKNVFSNKYKEINFRRKRISQLELLQMYCQTNVIIDIVRKKQLGLSFRVFEAMALEKKLITNNKNIINYDFFNTNNILVMDDENYVIDKNFIETEYQPIDINVFRKYTIANWVDKVFELK